MTDDPTRNPGEQSGQGEWNDPGHRAARLRDTIGAAAQILAAADESRASFMSIHRQWQLMVETFRGIRAEHSRLLTDLRGLRAELRASVRSYAMLLRNQGARPDELNTMLETVLREALADTPAGVVDSLHEDVMLWGRDGFLLAPREK